MGKPGLTEYYREKLEEGFQFQDFITDILYDHGMVVVSYVSRLRGRHAENKLGIEIKRDGKFRKTKNLYIETAEKSSPDRPSFVPSGIYRDDNSWLYAIGDEETLWIFAKKYLKSLEHRYDKREIPTSRGYLLPLADANKYCIRRIDISPGKQKGIPCAS